MEEKNEKEELTIPEEIVIQKESYYPGGTKEVKKLPVIKNEKQAVKEYVEEHNQNKVLKEHHVKLIDSRAYLFLKLFTLLILIGSIVVFFYMVEKGNFKGDISCNQNVTIPDYTCPAIPNCPSMVCPNCNVTCPNFTFPNNLSITLKNSS